MATNIGLFISPSGISDPFGVTIPATVPQGLEIPEGLMNNPVYVLDHISLRYALNKKCCSQKFVEKNEPHILCSIFFFENPAIREIMWKKHYIAW
jgi:hypothetical protein